MTHQAPALPGLTSEFAERFEVTRELGRGGMAVVLQAHDRKLDRLVALKLLATELSAAVGAERFTREIRLTARLVHPNIVPLYDSGQLGPRLYYVMPFIEGDTLRVRLSRSGPRPITEVIRILSDLAEALAYAHSQGIVHRDIKPENAFWSSDRALLADFGIATMTSTNRAATLTAHGMIIGTLAYMSPEQASGAPAIDGRADLYSLGCVAFELLTGDPPYVRDSPAAVIGAHLSARVPSIAERRADVPVGLAFVVERLLAKDPEGRPATANAFLDELRDGAAPTPQPGPAPAPHYIPIRDATDPPEITDLCIKGRALLVRAIHGGEGTREKYEMAKVYFENALAKAPTSARALVGLADVFHGLGLRGFMDPEEGMERGNELRRRALATGDMVSEVHVSLGYRVLYWEDDYDTAGLELARAVALDPDNSEARRFYGGWLKIAGRLDEALSHMQAAVRLAPLAPFMHLGLADVLMALGRNDEAVGPLRDALRLAPKYGAALERLEISCHRAGRHEEALDARRTWLGIRGLDRRMELLVQEAARDGWLAAREQDLRRDLDEALAGSEQEDPFRDVKITRQLSDRIIMILAELGDWTQAMDWVERGYLRRPGRLRRVLTDLPFDRHGLAVDPRYARLLRTAGLTELL
ncbi:MAG TPA: serine/threonine-protein kinase [Gemmatimonadales bacterium]